MGADGFEVLKRAWYYVRKNRFLWPFAFVIAVAGGGSQGFSLWIQSPIPRGLTGYSPIHEIGARLTDFARSNWGFWTLFIIIGTVVGLAVLALSALAQASAIGGVGELDSGRGCGFQEAFRIGREGFFRYFALLLLYVVVVALLSLPSILFWWVVGTGGFLLPCLGGLALGLAFLLLTALASVLFEIAGRYIVLEGRGLRDSVIDAVVLLKSEFKELVVVWLYVLVVVLAGTIAMAVLIAILATPLSWIFNAARGNNNWLLVALSMVAFGLAWAAAAALAGVFSITASATWTVAFREIGS